MAIKTTISQIEEVQTAISNIMAGAQEVWVGGKKYVAPDLDVLTRREDALLRRYRSEQGTGGITVNVGIPRRQY